jgi:hypothetical protein
MAREGEVMNYRLLALLITICICTSTTVFAQSVHFKKTQIASESYESVGVADLNGNYELVTGKRYRAHNGNDPGTNDPIGLYYYKWNGTSFVRHTIASGPLGVRKGTGIYFSIADLNDSGYMDIIVAGKDGLYLFYNEGFE